MATTFVIACPDCGKQVKVSEEHAGKRIKCKECGTLYPVRDPAAGASKAKGPPPAPKAKQPPEPPPPDPTLDPDYDPNDYSMSKVTSTLPRCPFCAAEMESEEAMICLECGYNTRTRKRPEVKQVYQNTGGQIFLWLLPGILTVLVEIGLVVWYVIFWMKIEGWMYESWFMDQPGPPVTYIVGLSPGMFKLYHALLIAAIFVPLTRFWYKRLVKDNMPQERKIKEEW